MSVNLNIDSIFCQAIEIESPEERDTYVQWACGNDKQLRGQIVRLLHAHFQGGSILDSPANGLAATIDLAVAELPGTVIGPYKLIEQIGEGGFGVVFLAEQERPRAIATPSANTLTRTLRPIMTLFGVKP